MRQYAFFNVKIKWSSNMDMFTDIQSKEVPYMTTTWLFQSAGDIIELDAWVPENVIDQCIEV